MSDMVLNMLLLAMLQFLYQMDETVAGHKVHLSNLRLQNFSR